MTPSTTRRSSVTATLIALLVGGVFSASCFGIAKNTKYWRTIQDYQAASPLELKHIPGSSSNCNEWELEYALPSGVRVSMYGSGCGPGSSATVKYSDEADSRFVYEYFDYVYPADMRLQGDILYTLVDGSTPFGNRYTQLIVFDLSARKTVRKVKIDAKDLPGRTSP